MLHRVWVLHSGGGGGGGGGAVVAVATENHINI